MDFVLPADPGFEVALYFATIEANLFSSPPQIPAPGATTLTLTGLADNTLYYLRLGIHPTGGSTVTPTGPTLTAITNPPIYVDSLSTSSNPDGLTPATAFPDVLSGVLTGFANLLGGARGANVWVRAGNYTVSNLPLASGVSVQGGFGAGFDLAARDPANQLTVWNVVAGQKGMEAGSPVDNGFSATLDGIRMTGNGLGSIAVDTNQTDPCSIELRGVVITDMKDRGIRLRSLVTLSYDITLASCQSSRNGADGLNGAGIFDYHVYNSDFIANVQEGLDLNQLEPDAGKVATLEVTGCRFFGNGTTINLASGLRAALTAPLSPTSGSMAVRLRGCAFERNRGAGCFLDHDYELVPNYSSTIVIEECLARANEGNGYSLDLDGPGSAFLERVVATGNGGHGLHVTSETAPGVMLASTSAFTGNLGFGVRAEGPVTSAGNRAVTLSHCLIAGNFGGGVASRDVPASATSCIFYQQATPFDANTTQIGGADTSDPAAIAFTNAPIEYCKVVSASGANLTLATAAGFPLDSVLELADDSNGFFASALAGAVVTLSTTPQDFLAPGLLTAFTAGTSELTEDYRLLAGSIALGVGLNGADAGLFGSPIAGAPGIADDVPGLYFFPADVSPALSATVGANESLTLTFSKTILASSANATTVRAKRGSTALNITIQTAGATLTIAPPGAGWGTQDFRVELDGLRDVDGTVLSGPFVLPFSR